MTQDAAPAIDIDTRERATIERLLRRHLPGVDVWAYGSRVRWNAQPQSDLDLVAFASPEQRGAVSQVREAFEESSLPFSVDLLIWDDLPESFHREIERDHVVMVSALLTGGASSGGAALTVRQTKWRQVRLGDLGEVGRGRSRHRPRHAPELYGGPYPFVQTGDIKASGGRIASHNQTYSELGLAQSRLWPANTMVITIAANIAETAILTYPACFPDSVVGFIADESKCDVRFIEYNFRLLKVKIQQENVGTGSVQDNINLQTLEELRFPSRPSQNSAP